MNKIVKALLTVLITLLLILLVPLSVSAIGIGPAEGIEITDASRGEEYQDTIFAINTDADENILSLSASGEISEWISFYDVNDPATPIANVTAPGNGHSTIKVRCSIPEDAPIGTSTGLITITGTPPVDQGGAQTTIMSAALIMTVHVVGVEEDGLSEELVEEGETSEGSVHVLSSDDSVGLVVEEGDVTEDSVVEVDVSESAEETTSGSYITALAIGLAAVAAAVVFAVVFLLRKSKGQSEA